VKPGDLGLHFMLAPPATEQRGFTAPVMTFLLASAFADPAVRRLVVDPDARNTKALAVVQRLGFQLGPVVELSTKPAQPAFLGRNV